MTRKGFVRRGNRRGGVFIDADDVNEWRKYAWFTYFNLLRFAREACAIYKKYGGETYRQIALRRMKNVRECREFCRALAAPRMVYREERP